MRAEWPRLQEVIFNPVRHGVSHPLTLAHEPVLSHKELRGNMRVPASFVFIKQPKQQKYNLSLKIKFLTPLTIVRH